MTLFFPSKTDNTKISSSNNEVNISVGDSMSISAGNSFLISGGSSSIIKIGPATNFILGSAVNINIASSLLLFFQFGVIARHVNLLLLVFLGYILFIGFRLAFTC